MRQTVALVALLLFAAPAGAQVLPDASLTGFICIQEPWMREEGYEGECWQPVPGAEVTLYKKGAVSLLDTTKSASTDDAGYFYIGELQAGDYTITITRAGVETVEETIAVSGRTDYQTAMTPTQVTATIKAVDPDGEALSGARVEAWGRGWGRGVTDAEGIYAFPTLAGYHDVTVSYPGLKSSQQWLFVDGTTQVAELETLPPATHFATGLVQDRDGEPVAGVQVHLQQYAEFGRDDWGHFENWTVTKADGSFRLGHYKNDYYIQATKPNHTTAEQWSPGGNQRFTFTISAIPAATAELDIRVVDALTGKPVKDIGVSAWHPEYGVWDCSDQAYAPMPMVEAVPAEDMAYSPHPYEERRCPIHVDRDHITGTIIPGYTIIEVWQDWYRCGNCTRYHTAVTTLDLQEGTNTLVIALTPRPEPSAILQGYVLGEDGAALPKAIVSLSNQDTYGWGEAGTDQDGSYKIRLVPGFHHVYVWAEGHLPWQGTVSVARDGTVDFDVRLKEGQAAYQPCCYYYGDVEYAEAGHASLDEGMGSSRAPAQGDYHDLRGGLGPYDANRAAPHGVDDQKAPGLAVWALLGLLAVVVRRKR